MRNIHFTCHKCGAKTSLHNVVEGQVIECKCGVQITLIYDDSISSYTIEVLSDGIRIYDVDKV